ncbi:immunity protein 43 of polymorphic toxin system [Chitinophaga skermanii]|uniref:Immunity protein 43 of polymorphic toxin system n=1 Tax=Chitinophaga skermanii TaxID=331697 RepID=A0A327QP71_9BACT|nr:hypothetical protein [Chitinophaga skermanii]RAJ05442.1 immunity protein 43 of polymorphic toxin system [Chitinophaga skermanii]
MEKLFIWFNRTQLPTGYPAKDDTILKLSFDPKKPKLMPGQPWKQFNIHTMPFPPEEMYQFPSSMYLVVTRKLKDPIKFDYYDYAQGVKLVSAGFLTFIQEAGLTEEHYEIATLHIINEAGEALTNDTYYALRFGQFNDASFDFPVDTKKRAAGLQGHFLYPGLQLNNPTSQQVFALQNFCYLNTLIFTAQAARKALQQFHYPALYPAEEFPFVFNNQHNWSILPFENDLLLKA